MSSTVFVNGVTLTAASWFQDVDNIAYQYLSGVAGTNTITATGPAGLGAYVAGLKFRFIPVNTNTGATTINITGTAALGVRNIFYDGAACFGGELRAGIPVEITDDGTQFHITSLAIHKGTWTPSLGGSTTYTVQTGNFERIGNVIHVRMTITVNAIGTGNTTTISGLPFSSSGVSGLSIATISSSATAIVSAFASIAGGANSIVIFSRTAAAASDSANAIFQNGTNVSISGTYQVT